MTAVTVNRALPFGDAELPGMRCTFNDVKDRLVILIGKCEQEGAYTRSNAAYLALAAIEALQKAE